MRDRLSDKARWTSPRKPSVRVLSASQSTNKIPARRYTGQGNKVIPGGYAACARRRAMTGIYVPTGTKLIVPELALVFGSVS